MTSRMLVEEGITVCSTLRRIRCGAKNDGFFESARDVDRETAMVGEVHDQLKAILVMTTIQDMLRITTAIPYSQSNQERTSFSK